MSTPHLQAGAETLLEDVQMSGVENKLQRLLPVGQGERRAERVHQQAANLHPEGVPTRPQDPPPLLVWCSSSTGAALQRGFEGLRKNCLSRLKPHLFLWFKIHFIH